MPFSFYSNRLWRNQPARTAMPLRWVLIIPFVVQTVGAVTFVGFLAYRTGEQATEKLANQLLQQTSERVSDRLDRYLHIPSQIVAINRLAVEQGTLNLNNREQLRQQFWQQMLLNPSLPASGFWSEAGTAIGYKRLGSEAARRLAEDVTGQTIPSETVVFFDFKPSQRRYFWIDSQGRPTKQLYQNQADFRSAPWYQDAKKMLRQGWTPVSLGQVIPVLQTVAVAPVNDAAGKLQGFFTVDYLVSEISLFLDQLQFSPTGQIFILERSGALVATSIRSEAAALQQVKEKSNRLLAVDSANAKTREVAQQLLRQFGNFDSLTQPQRLNLVAASQRQFVQVTPYQNSDGLDWYIVTVIPESDFLTEIQHHRNTAVLLCLLMLAVAIASGLAITNRVAARLDCLNRASRDLATGDLTQQFSADSFITEVQELAQSLNQMAEQNRRSFDRIRIALEESEEKFTTVFRVSPDPIAITTLAEGRILEGNNSLFEFFGYPRSEMVGHTILELNLWVTLEQRIRFRELLQQQGSVQNQEVQLQTKAGEIKTVLLSAEIRPLEGQNHVIVMVRDISERKRVEDERKAAELALRQSEERYRCLVELTPQLVWTSDAEGNDNYVSQQMCDYVGLPAEQMLNLDWQAVIHPEDLENVHSDWIKAVQSGTLYTSEYRLRRADGVYRWHLVRALPFKNEQGQIVQWFGVSIDISDRKQAEEELKQAKAAAETANQAKSKFLANMSHELRTPLTSILGFAQLIQMQHDAVLHPNHQKYIQTMEKSGKHLLNLINDVLNLSKIEANRLCREEQQIDLNGLLQHLKNIFCPQCDEKGLQLRIDRSPDVPQHLIVDAQKLQQVLINLLGNAIKFTSTGSVTLHIKTVTETTAETAVRVKTEREIGIKAEMVKGMEKGTDIETDIDLDLDIAIADRQIPSLSDASLPLSFAVQDTGLGMAPQEMELIFDAFAQTETGRQTAGGTGLGLTISQKLVQVMGGEITVDSVLGQGSTFQFTIPVQTLKGAAIPSSSTGRQVIGLAPSHPPYRILVVDDQPANRLLLVKLLEQLELDVKEAIDGEQAITLWQQWQPHLVWMDVRMPNLSGDEATRRIRAEEAKQALSHRTVVIGLTAQATIRDRALMLQAGCDDYISQPFDAKQLLDKMQQYLGLDYIYHDEPALTQASVPDLSAIALALSKMPPAWIADLHQAALLCREEAVQQLIQQIPPEHSSLAALLNTLSQNYAFDQIFKSTLSYVQSD